MVFLIFMNKKQIREWTKNEFEKIHNVIKDKEELDLVDFLRIRNFKANNFSCANEEDINRITKKAFEFAREDDIKEAINELIKLHGVAIPVASAILAMKFPDKYAIIDNRVIKALKKDEWLKGYISRPEI